MSSITTKYGTRINTRGLTPEQVSRVRRVSEENGSYGAKGAALADTMRSRGPGVPDSLQTGGGLKAPFVDMTNPATGTLGNVQQGNPGAQGDPAMRGRAATIKGQKKHSLGAFRSFLNSFMEQGPLDLSGAPTIAPDGAEAEAAKARDAEYGYITKDYANAKQQEVDAAKQELSERGIPIDPSPDSLYGRTLAQIDQKYQSMDDQAKEQAQARYGDTLTTTVGVQKTAHDAFVGDASTQHGATQGDIGQLAQIIGMFSDQQLKRLGLNQDMKLKLMALAKSGSGGGGGSSDAGGDIIGGAAPGFNIAG